MEVEILFRRLFSVAKKIENVQPDLVAGQIVLFREDFVQQGNAQKKSALWRADDVGFDSIYFDNSTKYL